jgi:preprotein translocase subunit YajC
MDPVKKQRYQEMMKNMTKEEIVVMRNGMIWNPEDIVYTYTDAELKEYEQKKKEARNKMLKAMGIGAIVGGGAGLISSLIDEYKNTPASAIPAYINGAFNNRVSSRDVVWMMNALTKK